MGKLVVFEVSGWSLCHLTHDDSL